MARIKVVASAPELEPIPGDDVLHVGPFASSRPAPAASTRNCVVAYVGNGTVNPKTLLGVLRDALRNGEDEIFFASQALPPRSDGPVHVAPRFDFGELMPRARLFVNHGGQNSVMTGRIHGVPQSVLLGFVFERRYNAETVVRLGAGAMLEPAELRADRLVERSRQLTSDPSLAERTRAVGARLLSLGGVERVLDVLEERFGAAALERARS